MARSCGLIHTMLTAKEYGAAKQWGFSRTDFWRRAELNAYLSQGHLKD
jgi:hypothetical protein